MNDMMTIFKDNTVFIISTIYPTFINICVFFGKVRARIDN